MKKSFWLLLCALVLPASPLLATEPLDSQLTVQLGSALLAGDPIGADILAEAGHRSDHPESTLGEGSSQDMVTDDEQPLPPQGDVTVGFKTSTALTPYLGAGTTDAPTGEDDIYGRKSADRAYRLAAGIGCELDESTALDLGYRGTVSSAVAMEEVVGNALRADFDDHNISLDLKMTF